MEKPRGLYIVKISSVASTVLDLYLKLFISVDRLEVIRVRLGIDRALFSQSRKIWVFLVDAFFSRVIT